MAFERVEYPQDPFGYFCKEFYNDFTLQQEDNKDIALVGNLETNMDHIHGGTNWDYCSCSSSCVRQNHVMGGNWEYPNSSSPEASPPVEAPVEAGKRKRRRTKRSKDRGELESQRMTHIAVERNRRKQMNEYLAVIRSLVPLSYVQRGDQASIVGGAINFVKELEQLLQTLEAHKRITVTTQQPNNGSSPPLFADFFSHPQYSTNNSSTTQGNSSPAVAVAAAAAALGDIEVTMVESHANVKILSKRRPRQLLKIVSGIQCLRFSVLHLNLTTVDQMVLYSISLKMEDGCPLTTADEIADAINHLLGRIEEESWALA